MFTLYLKKRENRAFFISPDLQFYSIYIVNNAASPYVENSLKHFYFNRSVGILEKKQKKCVSHSLCSVCWITEYNFTIKVGTREVHIEKWMYHTLWETYGTYYLNVREYIDDLINFSSFTFCFASLFTWLKQINSNDNLYYYYYFLLCNKMCEVGSGVVGC